MGRVGAVLRFGSGAVSRPQATRRPYGFAPTLIIIWFLGYAVSSFGAAMIPCSFRAAVSDAAAFLVCTSASGCVKTWMPVSPPIRMVCSGGGRYFHFARLSASKIRLARANGSLASQYVIIWTLWPANSLIFSAIEAAWASVKVRSATLWVSRAVSLSALAARSFASAICNRNPSAFLRATSAALRAFAARAFSWAACCSAWAARSFACADCSRAISASLRACAASFSFCEALPFSRATIWLLFMRRFVSAREAIYVKNNSPATPSVIRIAPNIPTAVCSGNAAAGLRTCSMKSETWCQYSSTNPMTTHNVAASNHAPQKSSDVSNVLEALSRAEGFIQYYPLWKSSGTTTFGS